MSNRSSQRRAVATPPALEQDHILIALIQCMATPSDVKAFLEALPASARSAPLAALHELLQAPQRAVRDRQATEQQAMDYIWPLLHLMELTPAAKRLALAAKAVFPAVYTNNYNPPEDMDAVAWLDAWKGTVTHYDHFDCRDDQELTRLCNVLRQCTSLKVVNVRDCNDDAAVLEAVMATARSIVVTCSQRRAALRATLARWLASGHAEHLWFQAITLSDDVGDHDDESVNEWLAQLLALPTTLSSLKLCLHADGTLGALVAVARSLPQLVSLRIEHHAGSETATVLHLLHQLNTTQLRSLDLDGSFECSVDALLGTLASLTALEKLSITRARILRPAFKTGIALTLRRVKLTRVIFSLASWRVFFAHVAHLEEFTWYGLPWISPPIQTIAPSLRKWIQGGARKITIDDCFIGDEGAFHLAEVLPRTTSSVGAIVDINCHKLSARSYVALGVALASCSGISIALPPPIESKMVEAQTALRYIKHRYDSVYGRHRLVLESHTMPAI
ncbi:hypothetical protein SPRG_11084 [Saprolegnia parasitica CBS 223.65]|uniref:F-box domain-containing protein n=1 Tax=Saprolegnia parasitica (strain CBS 223.65) TaxID=695850 RepID=A0A067BZD3_SAPPC|nr:hypothetical protein SPRG_11084 [Saprolegnia parasitica CBS 223.65]KDO23638.1 hypothetical protein SPRG_11084 [Saprolegnia parasitica CBS 223.65]|eukprot:XP_012205621.1 hypothetical protein SPRG_11084 [Saprolegnia parasitica CBS 223.65]